MIALVSAVLFVGYTLSYAAVANGGKLAARPWDALREDAYTGDSPGSASSSGGGGSSVFDKFKSVAGGIIQIESLVP